MQLPLQITFHQMEPSAAIEEIIRKKAENLDRFADHIMSCRVVVQPAGKHHEHGNLYQVRLDIKVAGGEIAITHEPGQHTAYRDLNVAIRDAFDSARRLLEDQERSSRGFVKEHEPLPHAKVVRLFPSEGYGFLRTPDDREIYFHRNSVLHDAFDRLKVGAEVAFAEEEGKKGPQASTVKLVGRHGRL
jgi:cold shock CspA family protein/ribosome-associated translation inhibitor RaiA